MSADWRPPLEPDHLYVAHDRIVCGRSTCAGVTAQTTGTTLEGTRVRPVEVEDAQAWSSAGLGIIRCVCGAVVGLQ